MLLDLRNLKSSVEREIQKELKSKSVPEILGFRLVKGPWEKTYVFDVEIETSQYSALVLDVEGKGLELAGPFRVTKKEIKK